jgi:hypothetical protein
MFFPTYCCALLSSCQSKAMCHFLHCNNSVKIKHNWGKCPRTLSLYGEIEEECIVFASRDGRRGSQGQFLGHVRDGIGLLVLARLKWILIWLCPPPPPYPPPPRVLHTRRNPISTLAFLCDTWKKRSAFNCSKWSSQKIYCFILRS